MLGFYIALIVILVISFITGNIILYFEHKQKKLEPEEVKVDSIEAEEKVEEKPSINELEPIERVDIDEINKINISEEDKIKDNSFDDKVIVDEEVI